MITVKQWLLTVIVVICSFGSVLLIGSPSGSLWFDNAGTVSFVSAILILLVSLSNLSFVLALTEWLAVSQITIANYQYVYMVENDLFFMHHEGIILALFASQLMILAYGGPWRGIIDGWADCVERLFSRVGLDDNVQLEANRIVNIDSQGLEVEKS